VEISNWLHNALIADLVERAHADDDYREADRLIHERMEDEHEVTLHLALQLRLDAWNLDGPSDLHATLVTLVPVLQRALNEWPLPEDGKTANELAQLACKNLSDYEVYASLLDGPAKWRRAQIGGGSVEKLADQMRPILLREFTSSLNEMLERWRKLDLPKLYGRWMEAKRVHELAERQARQQLSSEVRQRRRADVMKQYGKPYVPPGKTT
jgi:hypothetical protein